MVLILLGLLAAAGLPAFFRGTSGLEWRLARDGLRRDLATARATAIGRGRPTALLIEAGGYLVDLGAGEALRRSLPSGVTLVLGSGGGEAGRVSFGPDGRSGGAVLELAAGGRRAVLRVEEDGEIVWE